MPHPAVLKVGLDGAARSLLRWKPTAGGWKRTVFKGPRSPVPQVSPVASAWRGAPELRWLLPESPRRGGGLCAPRSPAGACHSRQLLFPHSADISDNLSETGGRRAPTPSRRRRTRRPPSAGAAGKGSRGVSAAFGGRQSALRRASPRQRKH